MVTYWLEGERKGGHHQYKSMAEMTSPNTSMNADPTKQTNSNPPDYLDYNFGLKQQQQQQQQAVSQSQVQSEQTLVNLDTS